MPHAGAATLTHLNVSDGGIPKRAVLVARVTPSGVEGDRQRNLKYHSGPGRAICLFSNELYAELRDEGIAMHPGDLGENFTTTGIDLRALSPGVELHVGDCRIRITKVRVPCATLKRWHPDLPRRIEGRSGWLARVLNQSTVKPGDAIVIM